MERSAGYQAVSFGANGLVGQPYMTAQYVMLYVEDRLDASNFVDGFGFLQLLINLRFYLSR